MAEMMTPIVNISRFDGVLGTSKGAMWINQSDSAEGYWSLSRVITNRWTIDEREGSRHVLASGRVPRSPITSSSPEVLWELKEATKVTVIYIQSFF